MFRSKCETCGSMSYIFPDQVEKIKLNPDLALHSFCKDRLKVGAEWFCIKCDASKKDGSKCKIISELTGEEAKKLIDIRSRETNLKGMGFYLGK